MRSSPPFLVAIFVAAALVAAGCASTSAAKKSLSPPPAPEGTPLPPAGSPDGRSFTAEVHYLDGSGASRPELKRNVVVSGNRVRAEMELNGRKATQVYG